MASEQLFEAIFQLKLTARMLEKSSKRCEKEAKKKKALVAKSIKEGDVEVARIHAADAIRKEQEANNFLRLSSKVDGMRSRIETVRANQQMSRSIAAIAKSLEGVDTLNLAQSSKVMDAFASKLEDMEVMERTVTEAMDNTTSQMTNEDDVRMLIQEVADENNLQLKELLPDLAPARPAERVPAQKAPAGAVSARSAAQ